MYGRNTQFVSRPMTSEVPMTEERNPWGVYGINQENTSPQGNTYHHLSRRNACSSTSRSEAAMVQRRALILEPTPQEDEDYDLNYGKNGYLPVRVGEHIGHSYQAIKKLGSGSYATVWMAFDVRIQRHVALKIGKCGTSDISDSEAEIRFMAACQESNNVVTLIDHFRVQGRYGVHVVMVSELLGPSLHKILNFSNQSCLPVKRIKKFCRDLLKGIDYMHSVAGIVHCDLKPENIMLSLREEDIDLTNPACPVALKIGDFGISAWSNDPIRCTVQTCPYRAPEALLHADVGTAADMWSFGCIVYEMVTRTRLFPCQHDQDPFNEFLSHFALISAEVGMIDSRLFRRTVRNDKYFDTLFGRDLTVSADPSQWLLIGSISLRNRCAGLSVGDSINLWGFLEKCLEIDPRKRITAKEALEHRFLKY